MALTESGGGGGGGGDTRSSKLKTLLFSPPTPTEFSERRVRFLTRRAVGGIRDDVAKLWTNVVEEEEEMEEDGMEMSATSRLRPDADADATDAGGAVSVRRKASFLQNICEGVKCLKEEWAAEKKKEKKTGGGIEEDTGGGGNDVVDDNGTVRVAPAEPSQQPAWTDRLYNLVFGDRGHRRRREYGMGVVGRLFRRQMKQRRRHGRNRQTQTLDDVSDCRPYLTYWLSTVQVRKEVRKLDYASKSKVVCRKENCYSCGTRQ